MIPSDNTFNSELRLGVSHTPEGTSLGTDEAWNRFENACQLLSDDFFDAVENRQRYDAEERPRWTED